MNLPKQQKKLYISPDGQSLQMKSVAALSKYGVLEYKFERLPSKLKPWYKYASEFVKVTKLKTPRVIYANNLLKCYLMENDPLNTCEVEFTLPTAFEIGRPRRKEVRFYHSKGSDEVELVFRDMTPGVQLRTMANQANRYQFSLHELDSVDPEMQYYAQEAMKAVKICEQKNLEIFSQLSH